MGRIYSTETVTIGGTKVAVRQVLFHGSKNVIRTMTDIVSSARAWLRVAIPELHANPEFKVQRIFDKCFILPPDTNAAMNVVKSGLTTIANFLNRGFGVKVRDDDDAHGYVSQYFGGRVQLVGGVVQYEDDGSRIARQGEIHVRKSTVLENPVLATITLIHEASHKFVNLQDFDGQGYFKDDLTFYCEPGLTWPQALRNADSYAVFVYKVVELKYKSVLVHGKGLVT